MEKLIYTLQRPAGLEADAFRDQLLACVPQLQASGARHIRVCASDSEVAEGAALHQANTGRPLPDAVLTCWVDTALRSSEQERVFAGLCESHHGYLVSESEPLVSGSGESTGPRTEGMSQIAFLQRPPRLTREAWLEVWLHSHTTVAIETQLTFGYRQNVVVRPLTSGAPAVDAIVEENFPLAAMTSPQVFYNAEGDEALYRQRLEAMMASCARFIDLELIDVIVTSEYLYPTF